MILGLDASFAVEIQCPPLHPPVVFHRLLLTLTCPANRDVLAEGGITQLRLVIPSLGTLHLPPIQLVEKPRTQRLFLQPILQANL